MEKISKKERKIIAREERLLEEEKLRKQFMYRRYGTWGAIALIILVSIFGLIKLASISEKPSQQQATTQVPIEITPDDIIIGTESAQVTIVEYADFQCPACAAYHPIVTQILEEYDGQVRLVYRFFPLVQIHKNAMPAAQAGYAAHQQGKFAQMSDALYTNQEAWQGQSFDEAKQTFFSYAQQLGLDMDQFAADFEADATTNLITKQMREGADKGVSSTPTFIIDGEKITNPAGYDAFKSIIEEKLSTK